jgi:hypothetical protein
MQAVTSLVAKYHDERTEGGREHHLVVAVHPSITAAPDARTAAPDASVAAPDASATEAGS